MAALPEQGALRVENPGEGEMHLLATGVDLQLQVMLRAALASRISHLQEQGTVEWIAHANGFGCAPHRTDGVAPGLAAEIGSTGHQLAKVGQGRRIRDRHGWRAG